MLKPNIKKILKHILISVVALSLFIELALMVMYGFLLVPWVPPFVIQTHLLLRSLTQSILPTPPNKQMFLPIISIKHK